MQSTCHASSLLRFSIASFAALSFTGAGAFAGAFTDEGNSGDFFTINESQVAIFDTGDSFMIDGSFEVSFTSYDGDGATLEDDKAFGSFEYFVGDVNLALPAGETFTGIELDTVTWDGRFSNDGQSVTDIYTVQLSDDGVNFGAPIVLDFTPPVDSSNAGFDLSTLSASGFFADYVRIGILSRVEAAGSGFNDPWSSRIEEVRLTSGVIPEPASAMLVIAGLAAAGLRRHAARA